MANHEINEEQEAVNKVLRMIETSDPVHADVYNALFSVLINNDVFLEKLANKMVQQVMISHVMDSTNPDMVMGADQGPVITKLIEKVREQVNVLNTKTQGLPLKMVVGSCNVDCKTYDSFLKAYVGGATIDTLSNFVNGCIVVPIQARTQYYEPGVVSITVNSDNWIRVQCDTETVAEVRCLLISQSS